MFKAINAKCFMRWALRAPWALAPRGQLGPGPKAPWARAPRGQLGLGPKGPKGPGPWGGPFVLFWHPGRVSFLKDTSPI